MTTASVRSPSGAQIVLAESDDTVIVEGNHYFPRDAVRWEYFEATDHATVCPWKGTAAYFSISTDGVSLDNVAWTYPTPKDAAAEIKDHVAFYPQVSVG